MTETNPVNCPHGVAMDIYCEKCVEENIKTDGCSVGTIENEIKLLDAVTIGVWNAAIEAAAKCAKKNGAYPNVLLKIMGLKK